MTDANILMLFAPQFAEFGCDVGREYMRRKGGGRIHGLCTGPISVRQNVEEQLEAYRGHLWHLHTEETKWLEEDLSTDALQEIDHTLGDGAAGRMIVADRRVGSGFVTGGLCRPDRLAKRIADDPSVLPQKYIQGLYRFLNRILEMTAPDMVFCYAIAGAPPLLLAELSRSRGIPFSRLAPIRVGSKYVIDDDPRGRLACVRRLYHEDSAGTDSDAGIMARSLLDDFRNNPSPPEYMRSKHALLKRQGPIRQSSKALALTAYHLAQSLRYREDRGELIARAWFDALTSWRRRFTGNSHFSAIPPAGLPYIYYPLHVDPEASTQVLAPMHTDQLSVIEGLAKSAPANMTVVVKEHAPMVGLRPSGFYRRIREFPRTILVAPDQNSISLVKEAAVVAVITGTAAWEAVRMGKPVVVIGDSPYLSIGRGMVHEPCLANLGEALTRAMSLPPAPDENIIRYLAACLTEAFDLKSSLMWGRYTDHPVSERTGAVRQIVDGILRREVEQKLRGHSGVAGVART